MLNSIFSRRPCAAQCKNSPISWIGIKQRTSVLLLGLTLMLVAAPPALADLMLYPTRIVFEKNQRAAQLELINNGQKTATYRISIVNLRMDEVGDFAKVDSSLPGELFSDKFIRYSPRQVELAPGSSQTVRISVRKPADLATGEYRSHFEFQRIPEIKDPTSVDAPEESSSKEIGITLTALMGATIPIIVRQGDTSADVTVTDLKLLKPANTNAVMLAMVLERRGDSSVYGDIKANFTPNGGKESIVGLIRGLAVYSPNALRRVKLALKLPSGIALKNGSLHVTFREQPDAGGKLIAEAVLELP